MKTQLTQIIEQIKFISHRILNTNITIYTQWEEWEQYLYEQQEPKDLRKIIQRSIETPWFSITFWRYEDIYDFIREAKLKEIFNEAAQKIVFDKTMDESFIQRLRKAVEIR